MADLVDFELTWAERIEADAFERGRQEGPQEVWQENWQEGKVACKRKMLLHLLRFRFPSVSDELVARVEAITDEALGNQASARGPSVTRYRSGIRES